jgi:hypothetical protein
MAGQLVDLCGQVRPQGQTGTGRDPSKLGLAGIRNDLDLDSFLLSGLRYGQESLVAITRTQIFVKRPSSQARSTSVKLSFASAFLARNAMEA